MRGSVVEGLVSVTLIYIGQSPVLMYLRQELQGSRHAVIGSNPAPDDQGECISYIYLNI